MPDALADLDARVRALLPPRYAHCSEAVRTRSMGSAGVRVGPDGRVAWDQIWTTFCDLALAGGPPHRGTLLPPATAAAPAVAAEIARGIGLVTFLDTDADAGPGWVAVACRSEVMAAWVVRAVVAENVSARRDGVNVLVPAGPDYRVEKEVKNVVAAVAKAVHYWDDHTPDGAASVLAEHLDAIGPDPAAPNSGWNAVPCASEDDAVWLLRAVAVEHVLVRREGATLFTPNPRGRPDGRAVERAFVKAFGLWQEFTAAQKQGGSA